METDRSTSAAGRAQLPAQGDAVEVAGVIGVADVVEVAGVAGVVARPDAAGVGEPVEAVEALLAEVVAVLGRVDVELLAPEGCGRLVGQLGRAERVCRLKKVEAARRAAAAGVVGADGAPDSAAWLAAASGEALGAAKADLDTLAALAACPQTAAAVADGTLSLSQARQIAAAEQANPGCEVELVGVARHSSFARLREESRRKRHEAIGAEELHARQRAARRLRAWTNEIGNIAISGELPPEVGVPLLNRLEAGTDRLWRQAKTAAAAGGPTLEAREAYAADALAAMVDGHGRGRSTSADVVVVVDLRAWRRGRAEGEEVCRIVGGGGLPVSVARSLAADPFFKAVVHDGVNILTVAHFGRRMSAELRTALDLGPPPLFGGVTCCEEGCDRRHGLEWDHLNPVANNGPTSYANLKPRCWPHHQHKTERDRQAGLLGPAPPNPPPRA